MSFNSLFIRKQFGKGDRQRDAGLSTPADIGRKDNIRYGKDKKWQILDVYRPKEKDGKLPVIISVHGGGWVYGSKETYQFYCMNLAQRGFAVVNFSYRLAPEHRYPAQLADVNAVVKWVLANSEEYGFDLNNVFAVGDSAGAHLLSAYCAAISNPDFAAVYALDLPEFSFNAIALNCGVYHQDVPKKKHGFEAALLNDVLPRKWDEKDLRNMNTYDKVREGFAPSFVMTCNGDFLKGQIDYLVPELEKHGIEHEVHIYGSDDNVLGHVFHVNIRYKDAEICNNEECAFFLKHLK